MWKTEAEELLLALQTTLDETQADIADLEYAIATNDEVLFRDIEGSVGDN